MRIASALVTLVVSALIFASGVSGAHAQPGKGNYQVQVLRSSFGIPLDRPWGQVHFDTRGGSSYIQAVTFRPGGPDARAIVTYSQSSDPESPHFADMTRLFSESGGVTLPFMEGDIRRDPNLTVLKLSEKR